MGSSRCWNSVQYNHSMPKRRGKQVCIGFLRGTTTADSSMTSRRAIKQLGCRCESYIIALNDAAKTSTSEAMEDAINASKQYVFVPLSMVRCDAQTSLMTLIFRTLRHIEQNLIKWHNMSKMTAFVRQMDTSEEIRQCHQALDSLCANFFVRHYSHS